MKRKILIVEDEPDIRELIALHLSRGGYEVTEVDTVEEGLNHLEKSEVHLIVLDWMLPGMSGIEGLKKIRETSHSRTPILMVTAKAEAADIVKGLESGSDDYLTKPFEPEVLLARVHALLRRTDLVTKPSSKDLVIGELRIQPEQHEVHCQGTKVQLTASEFQLLLSLVENRGKVLTRDQLIKLVLGNVTVVDRAIDTHVFGLRKKLGACADVIETIRGVGYRVKPE